MPPWGPEEGRGGLGGRGVAAASSLAGGDEEAAGLAGLGCGWTERRGRRAQRPGPRTHRMGPRGRGVSATRETRASTALRRAGGLAGKRGETGRRRRCRGCCHRAINTGSAHTRRRLRRAPSAKSAGSGPRSRSARATAPRR